MENFQETWKEFRELFIAAHHNPIARRRENDPYAIECREAFDRLDALFINQSTTLSTTLPLSADQAEIAKLALGSIAGLIAPNQQWLQEGAASGHIVSMDEAVAQGYIADANHLPRIKE